MAQTVTTTQPSQYIQDLLTNKDSGLFPQLSAALDAPYVSYGGPRVAGFSSDQQRAFELARQSVGATDPQEQQAGQLLDQSLQTLTSGGQATQDLINQSTSAGSDWITRALSNAETMTGQGNPLLDRAVQMMEGGAAAPTSSDLASYMNPFQQDVIDTTMSELNRQDAIARQGRNASAVQSGAFGGGRQAVMEAEAGRNLADVQARTLAQLNSQNFNTALGASQNEKARMLQAGGAMAGAGAQDVGLRQGSLAQMLSGGGALSDVYSGGAQLQAGLTGQQAGGIGDLATKQLGLGSFIREQDIKDITNLFNMGGSQQAQRQAGMDVAYQDFLNQRQYEDPRAKVQFMSDIIRGAPSGSQSFSTTYQDPMSPLQAFAGMAPLVAAFV
jgi:hypothetical protein